MIPRAADTWDLMTALAVTFNFQPDSIDALTLRDALRWAKQAEKLHAPPNKPR